MVRAKEISNSIVDTEAVLPVRGGLTKPIYTVRLQLDNQIVQKHSSDNLCLARKGNNSGLVVRRSSLSTLVNDEYSIVFLGKSMNPTGNQIKLQAKDEFKWEDQFRVICARPFKALLPVCCLMNSWS